MSFSSDLDTLKARWREAETVLNSGVVKLGFSSGHIHYEWPHLRYLYDGKFFDFENLNVATRITASEKLPLFLSDYAAYYANLETRAARLNNV